MEKFINLPLMKGFLPPYLQDIAILKQNQQIMVNLKGLTSHLVGVWQSKLVLAKDIVCTLVASSKSSRNKRHIVKILGVNRWNIKKVIERHVLLDIQMVAFWLMHKCHKHTCCLLDVISILVQNWWEKDYHLFLTWRILSKDELGWTCMRHTPHIICKCHRWELHFWKVSCLVKNPKSNVIL